MFSQQTLSHTKRWHWRGLAPTASTCKRAVLQLPDRWSRKLNFAQTANDKWPNGIHVTNLVIDWTCLLNLSFVVCHTIAFTILHSSERTAFPSALFWNPGWNSSRYCIFEERSSTKYFSSQSYPIFFSLSEQGLWFMTVMAARLCQGHTAWLTFFAKQLESDIRCTSSSRSYIFTGGTWWALNWIWPVSPKHQREATSPPTRNNSHLLWLMVCFDVSERNSVFTRQVSGMTRYFCACYRQMVSSRRRA